MGQLTAGAADQPCFFMFFSGGSGGFTMDLPWIYHGFTMISMGKSMENLW